MPHKFSVDNPQDKYFKLRFAAPFFDFILQPNLDQSGRFSYELPDPSKEYHLKELYSLSDLILFLNLAQGRHKQVGFEVQFESQLLAVGTIDLPTPFDTEVLQYMTAISNAWKVAKYFDIHSESKLLPSELWRQHGQLLLAGTIFSRDCAWVRMIFWANIDTGSEEKLFCVPFATTVIIGQYRIALSVAVIGIPEPTGNISSDSAEFELKTTEFKLCQKFLYSREEPVRHSAEDLINWIVEDHEETHHILRIDSQ